MLQRLLKYPHAAVFDDAPGAELALRVRHADGAKWEVADEALDVRAGDLERTYQLADHTFGSLALALQADGFDVPTLAPELEPRSALAMAEAVGDQGQSNGDHIHAFTSLLWVLLSGYGVELREAERQVIEALRQMFIPTAEAEWLDLWATLYSVLRAQGEADADLRDRIPKEAFRVRVNGLAIEDAIKDVTGESIELREPWREMFRLDESQLSGTHHFADGFYSYFLIQPIARTGGVHWPGVLDVIHRNRAAGIEVYAPATHLSPRFVVGMPPLEYVVGSSSAWSRSIFVTATGEAPLGVMLLDDNTFTINHLMQTSELRTYSNAIGLEDAQLVGLPRNIAMAAIVLSGGFELGNENAILSRGEIRIEVEPEPTLSAELAVSDYSAERRVARVERVTISQFAAGGLQYPVFEITVGSRTESVRPMSAYVERAPAQVWVGPWGGNTWLGEYVTMGATRIDKPAGDILNDTLLLNVSVIT